jgi:hypothetical protein
LALQLLAPELRPLAAARRLVGAVAQVRVLAAQLAAATARAVALTLVPVLLRRDRY